jgi:hypothetical protein
MRKHLLLLLLFTCFGAAAGENLLKSPDFAADEYGEFGVWTITKKTTVTVTRLPKQGPDGKDAVRLDLSKGAWISHKGLKLIGGAKYKFGGYVRTSGFSGSEYNGFMIHDAGWNKKKMFRSGRFFRHTGGKWMPIEQTFTAPADGMYELNIYAPGQKGTLEICGPFVVPLDEKGAGSQFVPPPLPKKKMTGKNIIRNTEFQPDMFGEFGVWSIRRPVVGITRLPGEGVDGSTAVRLDFSRQGSMIHDGLKVVKGSKYKFGAYVRTAGFSGKEYYGIMFHNSGWTKLFKTRPFPADTNGKWVRIESTMTAPSDGLYQLNIYAPGPKGVLEISRPFVIPLDEDAVKAAGISHPVLENWRRIYPVTLDLASLDPRQTEFTVAVHLSLPDAVDNYTVSAELAGQKQTVGLNAVQRVKVQFKDLPLGKTELKLQLISKKDSKVVLENSYPCEVKAPVAKVAEKPLNNLVSEICRFEKLKDGEYEFTVSDEAWYFIGLARNEKNFTVKLDGGSEPVILPRENEPADTMRFLKPGKHKLAVSGIASADNALVVRKVKQLLLFQLHVSSPKPGSPYRFTYDLAFYRRRLWHNFNTQMLQYEYQSPTGCDVELARELHARGLKIISSGDVGPKINWTKPDVIEKNIRTANAISHTDGRALDEIGSRYAFEMQLATGDAFWNLLDFNKDLYLWMAQIRGYLHYPIVNSHLLAAVGNSAHGHGRMLMETYMLTTHDPETYDGYLSALNHHLEWADRCVPGGRSRIGFMISGYNCCGAFNTWIHPQTDYKCIVDGFFRKLATDPGLKGFAALGMYNILRCDEEIVRWTAAVVRHYAVEGKTENLAEKYGFRFNPGHLRNGDFDDKTDGWTVRPAKEGALVHRYEKRFGVKTQSRQRDYGSSGDNAMLFTRCTEAPNKLSQKTTGLIPGKKYALRFVLADLDDVKKPVGKPLDFTFRADISDSRKVDAGSYFLIQPGPTAMRYTRLADGSFTRAKFPARQIATGKIVFIPDKPEVTLTFSDWKDDRTPGGAIGQKLVLNFIGICPYFDGE